MLQASKVMTHIKIKLMPCLSEAAVISRSLAWRDFAVVQPSRLGPGIVGAGRAGHIINA